MAFQGFTQVGYYFIYLYLFF